MADTEPDRFVKPATCPIVLEIESRLMIIPVNSLVTTATLWLILETETDIVASVNSTPASWLLIPAIEPAKSSSSMPATFRMMRSDAPDESEQVTVKSPNPQRALAVKLHS